jgi:hypothetical protein
MHAKGGEKKSGAGKEPKVASTDDLLRQILSELKALRKEKGASAPKGPGKGGPGKGSKKKPDDEESSQPFIAPSKGQQPKQATQATDNYSIILQIFDELDALREQSGQK